MSLAAAQRTKKIVDELADIKLVDLLKRPHLKAQLKELDTCLTEIRDFATLVEGIVDHGPLAPKGRSRAVKATGTLPRRRGRGPGEFSATPFILNSVTKAGTKGIRPREIVEQVQVAAPGQHVRPPSFQRF